MTAFTPVNGSEPAMAPTGPTVRVRMPAGGWQVGFRTRPDGRTVVEVIDPDGSLAGLVASTRRPLLSVDAGWSGIASGLAGGSPSTPMASERRVHAASMLDNLEVSGQTKARVPSNRESA